MSAEFARLGVDVETVANDGFVAYIRDGKVQCNLNADFVLYFDKERIVPQLLEKSGLRVFNSARATEICDDKMLTHTILANNGIPMPDTVAGPLCYNPDAEVTSDYLEKAIRTVGLPMVVKECHGSFGEQVYLCRTLNELRAKLEKLKMTPYLLQHYEQESSGKDLRVTVIGGKAVCAMKRTNSNGFRSNAALGSSCEGVPVPSDIGETCQKAAKLIGLDYCGVDVLLTDPPKLCEVNSNAMFERTEQVTGFNVARAYAEHIVNSVKNSRTKERK